MQDRFFRLLEALLAAGRPLRNKVNCVKAAAILALTPVLLAACQSLPPDAVMHGASRGAEALFPALSKQDQPAFAATRNAALVLGEEEGKLLAQDVITGQRIRLGPVAEKAVISNVRLTTRREHVLALWLEKESPEGQEERYFTWMRVSRDGGRSFSPPVRLGREGTYVLQAEVSVAHDGRVWIATLELDAEDKHREIRMTRWLEGEQPQSETLARADKSGQWIEPRLALDGERAWVAWLSNTEQGAGAIEWMETSDGGKRWERSPVVATSQLVIGLQLLRARDRLLLTWMDAGNTIRGLARADGTTDWKEVNGLPSRAEGLIGGYRASVAPDGSVHVLNTLRRVQGEQHGVYYRRTDDGGDFGAPQRLNTSMPAHAATADLPAIAFGDEGRNVFVAWLDLRHYRSSIYGNHSVDGGRTWLESDFPVNLEPGQRMAMFPALAHVADQRFAIAWTEWSNTLRQAEDLKTVATLITPPATSAVAPRPDPDRLKQRVSQYWQARVDGDMGGTFPLYDPFYRERTTVENHVEVRSRVKVLTHGFEIGQIRPHTPSRYAVTVRFEHEVEPFKLKDGSMAKVPRGWVDTEQQWIWIDGDWHVVYLDVMKKPVVSF